MHRIARNSLNKRIADSLFQVWNFVLVQIRSNFVDEAHLMGEHGQFFGKLAGLLIDVYITQVGLKERRKLALKSEMPTQKKEQSRKELTSLAIFKSPVSFWA